MYESDVGYIFFKDDYPEFAKFILSIGSIKDIPGEESWEKKIINYADWRVFVDDVISLKERLTDLYERYKHKFNEKQKENWEKKVEHQINIEKEIMDKIGMKAEDLK